MRWAVLVAILAVVASFFVAAAPVATILVVVGLIPAALFLIKPKLAAGVASLALLFGSGLPTVTGVDELGYLDEGVVCLSLVMFSVSRLARGKMLRRLPGGWWLAFYLLLGAISSAVNEVPFSLASQSTFLMLKGFILAYAFAQLDWTRRDIRTAAKLGGWVVFLALAAGAVNFLIPEVWADTFSRRDKGVDYRLGLPSLIGPFDHEFAFGQFMAMAAAAVLAFRANIRKGFISGVLLFGTIVGAILSFRRKSIVAALAALVTTRLVTRGRRLRVGMAVCLILPLVIMVGWDSLMTIVNATYQEYFYKPTETARTMMYRDSVALAAAAFPLGVGFARFGSYMASQEYSPEYVALGYSDIYGVGRGIKGAYLSDTFWPAIIGEAGFLGLIAFAAALIVLARQGAKLAKQTTDPYLKWPGIVLVAWYVEFAIESVAAPVFNSPPLFGLFFGLTGIVVSLADQQRRAPRLVAPNRTNGKARQPVR